MRYLSLCSGIEAASLAWAPLGWTPVAFAERDPDKPDGGFAAALLAQRFPDVPNLGDLALITSDQIRSLGPIDVVVGGTPCQDLSIAGQRAGIDGERSQLFFDFVRIFDAARHLCGARWCLWENVPGAFSTNEGRDFARVVGELAGCDLAPPIDGWGSEGVALGDRGLVEWSVLDAQWFGVAQRRERLFALLDAGDWQGRRPLLLEPESLRGNSPPSREARARVARALTASTGGCSAKEQQHTFIDEQVAGPLLSNSDGGGFRTGAEEAAGNHLIPDVADPITSSEGGTYTHEGRGNFRLHNVVADVAVPLTSGGHPGSNAPGRRKEDDVNLVVAPAITAREAKGPDSDLTSGTVVACFDTTQITHRENRSTCSPETASLAQSAHPPAIALRADASRDGVAKTPSPDAEGRIRLRDPGFNYLVDVAPTLDASAPHSVLPPQQHAMAFKPSHYTRDKDGAPSDVTPPLSHDADKGDQEAVAYDGTRVRRLTPTECERLQGMPDGWTAVTYRGKPAKDGPRYAALGNSMAVPVIRWIGERIAEVSK